MAVRAFEPATGQVATFDEARGLGTIAVDGDGDASGRSGGELPFHCTAIADGTRTVPVGERVRFEVTPGRLGRWEATHVEPLFADGAAPSDQPADQRSA